MGSTPLAIAARLAMAIRGHPGETHRRCGATRVLMTAWTRTAPMRAHMSKVKGDMAAFPLPTSRSLVVRRIGN
jgi:hypothetical protein